VARPSIRELSDAIVYDYELQDYLFGNSALEEVEINNYDLRLERYFKSRDNISISVFYKNFVNHIELVKNYQGYSWQNVDESYAAGIELEGRKQLFKNLELIGNITLVQSMTNYVQYQMVVLDGIKNYIPVDTLERAMFGQAPYVFNGILNYNLDSLGLSISASYNLQGEKLVVTSIDGNPDIYEQPRHIVDLKVSKKIGKHFTLYAKAQNILNSPVKWSYDYSDKEINWDQYSYGTTYTVGLSYKLMK
jgi:outer membrane receptor protein involved in Fe transport